MAARQKDPVPRVIAVCAYAALIVLCVVLALTTSYGY